MKQVKAVTDKVTYAQLGVTKDHTEEVASEQELK